MSSGPDTPPSPAGRGPSQTDDGSKSDKGDNCGDSQLELQRSDGPSGNQTNQQKSRHIAHFTFGRSDQIVNMTTANQKRSSKVNEEHSDTKHFAQGKPDPAGDRYDGQSGVCRYKSGDPLENPGGSTSPGVDSYIRGEGSQAGDRYDGLSGACEEKNRDSPDDPGDSTSRGVDSCNIGGGSQAGYVPATMVPLDATPERTPRKRDKKTSQDFKNIDYSGHFKINIISRDTTSKKVLKMKIEEEIFVKFCHLFSCDVQLCVVKEALQSDLKLEVTKGGYPPTLCILEPWASYPDNVIIKRLLASMCYQLRVENISSTPWNIDQVKTILSSMASYQEGIVIGYEVSGDKATNYWLVGEHGSMKSVIEVLSTNFGPRSVSVQQSSQNQDVEHRDATSADGHQQYLSDWSGQNVNSPPRGSASAPMDQLIGKCQDQGHIDVYGDFGGTRTGRENVQAHTKSGPSPGRDGHYRQQGEALSVTDDVHQGTETTCFTYKIKLSRLEESILSCLPLLEDLRNKFPQLGIRLEKGRHTVFVTGGEVDVRRVTFDINNHLKAVKNNKFEIDAGCMKQEALNMFRESSVLDFVRENVRSQKVACYLTQKEDSGGVYLWIYADDTAIDKAVKLVISSIVCRKLEIDFGWKLFLDSEYVKQELNDFQKKYSGKVTITTRENVVTLSCTVDIEDVVLAAVNRMKKDFLTEGTKTVNYTPHGDLTVELCTKVLQDDIQMIEEKFGVKCQSVKWNGQQGWKVTGPNGTVEKACGTLGEYSARVTSNQLQIQDKTAKDFFKTQSGQNYMASVCENTKCLVTLLEQEVPETVEGVRSGRPGPAPGTERSERGSNMAGRQWRSADGLDVALYCGDGRKSTSDVLVHLTQNEGQKPKIVVHKGEIAKMTSEVIVNTTDTRLKLDVGAVSASILREAGPEIQRECDQYYNRGVKFGDDVAITHGYRLKCKHVFHGALPPYSKDHQCECLKSYVLRCLTKADKKKYSSISFPALGTGNLYYPRDLVAKTMFDTVNNYFNDVKDSSIERVSFVVYPKDIPTVKAFEAEEERQKLKGEEPSGATGGPQTGSMTRETNAWRKSDEISTKKMYLVVAGKLEDDIEKAIQQLQNKLRDLQKQQPPRSYLHKENGGTKLSIEKTGAQSDQSFSPAGGSTTVEKSEYEAKRLVLKPKTSSGLEKATMDGWLKRNGFDDFTVVCPFIQDMEALVIFQSVNDAQKLMRQQNNVYDVKKFPSQILKVLKAPLKTTLVETVKKFVKPEEIFNASGAEWSEENGICFLKGSLVEIQCATIYISKAIDENIVTRQNRQCSLKDERKFSTAIGRKQEIAHYHQGLSSIKESLQTRKKPPLGSEILQTKQGVKVFVYQENILDLDVDSIICGTNVSLDNSRGLANKIAIAAGPELERACSNTFRQKNKLNIGDCCTTTAGKLHYKFIIHVVIPEWRFYKPYNQQNRQWCQDDLCRAILNSLEEATKAGARSVALPAVGHGHNPNEMCTAAYREAVTLFCERHKHPTVAEIHFVDQDKDGLRKISEVFQPSKPKATHPVTQMVPRKIMYPFWLVKTDTGGTLQLSDKLTVCVIKQQFTDTQAAALVSLEDEQFQSKRYVARAIEKKSGAKYIQEKEKIKKKNRYPKISDVFHTRAGDLGNVSFVLHVIAPICDSNISKDPVLWKGVTDTIRACLHQVFRKVDELKLDSVAMPSFASGTCQECQAEKVWQICVEEVQKYVKQQNPNSQLDRILLVDASAKTTSYLLTLLDSIRSSSQTTL